MRVIVCGSRNFQNVRLMEARLDLLPRPLTIVHGGCTGADALAAAWARRRGDVDLEEHRAEWETEGKAAGPRRNQRMVDAGADLVLAYPSGNGKGTQDLMRKANAAGIPVEVA